MKVRETAIPGILILEPRLFRDDRGYFLETWNADRYRGLGVPGPWKQDNASSSHRGVLRGLHYQHPHGQGKLVSVLRGEVWDVAVDIRRGSPTFGEWVGCTLSHENALQFYVPPGFAHGFVVTSDEAIFSYKCTDVYAPDAEGAVLWNDPALEIDWPVEAPVLSDKDAAAKALGEIDDVRLPVYETAQYAGEDI